MKKLMIIISLLVYLFGADLFAQTYVPEPTAKRPNWIIRNFVDAFGDPIEVEYIEQITAGVFSNSATTGSILTAELKVSNLAQKVFKGAEFEGILISFKFYEHAGIHPVKTPSTENFTVLVKTAAGERIKFSAIQFSTQIYFNPAESKRLSRLLLDGGTIKMNFRDSAIAGLGSSYLFEINGDGYSEVYYKYFKVSKPK